MSFQVVLVFDRLSQVEINEDVITALISKKELKVSERCR
jgi:hypothetical protein